MIQTGRFTLKQVFKDYPWTTVIIFFSILATIVLVTVNLFIWINDEKLEESLTHHYSLIDDYHSIVYLDELLNVIRKVKGNLSIRRMQNRLKMTGEKLSEIFFKEI